MARKRKLKAIDLFAGAGGFSLGLQQAGVAAVAAVVLMIKLARATAIGLKKIYAADASGSERSGRSGD